MRLARARKRNDAVGRMDKTPLPERTGLKSAVITAEQGVVIVRSAVEELINRREAGPDSNSTRVLSPRLFPGPGNYAAPE